MSKRNQLVPIDTPEHPFENRTRNLESVMRHEFRYGETTIVVEGCPPGQGPMRVGIGTDANDAISHMLDTPIEGHFWPREAIGWLVSEGMLDPGAEEDASYVA